MLRFHQLILASATLLAASLTAAAAATAGPAYDRQWCLNASGDGTVEACTRAIDSKQFSEGDLAELFYNRGIEYRVKEDHDRAIKDFDDAIRLAPKLAKAFNERGFAYAQKDDPDRAIVDYNEAIKLDPAFGDAFRHRGMAYAEKDDYDRAIADFSEAIRINPKDNQAFYQRGMAWKEKDDKAKAIADLKEARRLNPDHEDTIAALKELEPDEKAVTTRPIAPAPATPTPPPATPGATPERWNAVAGGIWHDKNGTVRVAVGYSGIQKSAADAERVAEEQCRNVPGYNCKSTGTWSNGCIYITVGSTDKRVGWNAGETADKAKKNCEDKGFNCKTPIGGCLD